MSSYTTIWLFAVFPPTHLYSTPQLLYDIKFVWGLIIALIVFTALLSVWFSERVTNKRARRQRQPKQIRRPKNLVYARWAIDEFLQKGTFFCSAGVEQDKSASLPAKLLMFGFSFFILIVISAYVANLAAFLTNDVPDYVGTVEGEDKSGYTHFLVLWF